MNPQPPSEQNRDHTAGDPPPPKSIPKFISFLLKAVMVTLMIPLFSLLIVLVALIFIPLFLSAFRRHRSRGRRRRVESSNGFPPERIKKLPQFRFSDPIRFAKYCAVCLDGFDQGQWCRRLIGCGHVFHRKCVDAWLVKDASCPVCRARALLEEESEGIPVDLLPIDRSRHGRHNEFEIRSHVEDDRA